MSTMIDFDLGLDDEIEMEKSASTKPFSPLDEWAAEQLSKPTTAMGNGGLACFDCETAPLADEDLRAIYVEPTWEEFAANCDSRWKEDTKREKFEASRGLGFEKFRDRSALSPLTGRIVAIGTLQSPATDPRIYGSNVVADVTEIAMLKEFWAEVQGWIDGKATIVTHNGFFFDLPFLATRSMKHGVDIPPDVLRIGGRYPQWSNLFVDTMQVMAWGKPNVYTSLNTLAAFFGLKGKTEGVEGKLFGQLWQENHTLAVEYLKQDVKLTAEIARRLMIV